VIFLNRKELVKKRGWKLEGVVCIDDNRISPDSKVALRAAGSSCTINYPLVGLRIRLENIGKVDENGIPIIVMYSRRIVKGRIG